MASRDQFQRFLFEHSQVRGAWVQLGESFKEITGQAPYPDSVRELLGESLVASVLMSSTLKFKGTLSLQAAGEGALSTLMAECSHDRHIRGLARFDADAVSGETLHELLGKSRMAITITPEQGQRYQGVVKGIRNPGRLPGRVLRALRTDRHQPVPVCQRGYRRRPAAPAPARPYR